MIRRDETATALAIRAGEDAGVRLEIVAGIPVWEALPAIRHQRHSFRIQSSIRTPYPDACGCHHYADILVRFPDDSIKRPDIAIFCHEPDEELGAVTAIPDAVIEILSPGYESKDLSVGVPFYLRMGIKDVIVFDPETGLVRHFRPGRSESTAVSEAVMTLECGCQATV